MSDPVNHPEHYTSHPSGIECIQVTEHMGFNIGNAVKYLWRADLKGNQAQDLRKAVWYVSREIDRLERSPEKIDAQCTSELMTASGDRYRCEKAEHSRDEEHRNFLADREWWT